MDPLNVTDSDGENDSSLSKVTHFLLSDFRGDDVRPEEQRV